MSYNRYPKEWRDACVSANDSEKEKKAKASKELREERRRTEKLEKELNRKEKVAEAAALLVLRKKADAIWGTEEEEE